MDDSVPVLLLPDGLGFEGLREWLRERLPEHAESLAGRSIRLDLGEREIKLFDLRRLIHMMRDELRIDVTGLYVRPAAVHQYAERELKLKLFLVEASEADADDVVPEALVAVEEPAEEPAVAEAAPPAAPETVPANEPVLLPRSEPSEGGRRTLTVHRTLRSGASIRFDGDVFLFGDVNPGAQVVAAGNIVVLGAMKGMAHAGATGDEDSFVLGFDLRPTQLRIGRRIAIPPDRDEGPRASAEVEMAHVVDGQIVIEPYRGKLR